MDNKIMSVGIKVTAASIFALTWIGCKAAEHFSFGGEYGKIAGGYASYFASCNSLLCFIGTGALRAKQQGNYTLLITSIVGAALGGFHNYRKNDAPWNNMEDGEKATFIGKTVESMAVGAAAPSFLCSL